MTTVVPTGVHVHLRPEPTAILLTAVLLALGGCAGSGAHDPDGHRPSAVASETHGRLDAKQDVLIDSCGMELDRLVVRFTVTNDERQDYTYDLALRFQGETADEGIAPVQATVDGLLVRGSASQPGHASVAYDGNGTGAEYKGCVVAEATRTAA
ncbi:hypothetical protein [Streptomyces sp. NPDC015131]|uniref:hypothetical protein n=1 Tax=Streptomyces sp. NPDC015131 TaxID=3364941 RepID=UPI0036FEF422